MKYHCKYDELVPVSELKPNPKNKNRHPKEQIERLAKIINYQGFRSPIVVSTLSGYIVKGHGRLEAAKALDVKAPVVFQDYESEEQEHADLVADNEIARWAEFDAIMMQSDVKQFDSEFDLDLLGIQGFRIEEVLRLDDNEDEVPDQPEEPRTVLGDVYELGEHRLVCGDATSITDVDKLMCGKKADMVFTDPPYNTGMTGIESKGKPGEWLSHMFNDSFTDEQWETLMADFCSMYYSQMKDNTGAYICLDWRRNHELMPHLKKSFKVSNVIVWDKMVHGLGSDYKYTYELINVCKKGKPELDTHQGEREYSDVWHIQRKMGKNKEHATAKPIEIIDRCLRHASKPNSLVIDYFGGSGSTMVACQKTNRKCYMMELDPKYCDVIVQRYCDYVGEYQVKLNGEVIEWPREIN